MNKKYSIKQIREVWTNAYLNGEVDWLSYLESSSFFVKKGASLTSKSEQITNIKRNQAKLPGKKHGEVEFKESVMEIRERSNWTTVSGFASFKRNGKIVSQCEFFELWLIIDDRWQITSLCVEDIDGSYEI